MKCILHIGTAKTGTTLLQNWIYDNKVEFSKSGIYISENLGKTNNRLIPAYFSSQLDDWAKRNSIKTLGEKNQYFSSFLKDLETEISNAKESHQVFVITSEHLHSRLKNKEDIKHLHSFLVSAFDEVEVVCYFREQFDIAVSLYSTGLKHKQDRDLESFIKSIGPKSYYFNYTEIADSWSDVFGRNNCNFRIYDREKFVNNDIRIDFLNVIEKNFNHQKLNMKRTSSNSSLHLLQSFAFKVINQKIPYWKPDGNSLNTQNTEAKAKLIKLDSFKFGKIVSKNKILTQNKFKEINNVLFEKYFQIGDSFPETEKNNTNITMKQVFRALEDGIEFGIDLNANVRNSLSNDEIITLTDTAKELYAKNPKSRKKALALMKIALKQRPNSPKMKKMVHKWSSRIDSMKNN